MEHEALRITGYGQWDGNNYVDNSVYENLGMFFKGGIPVNGSTIEERIGVRTRVVAPENVRIGCVALRDLLENNEIDPSKIKTIIGATNLGDNKFEHGPLVKHPFESIKAHCPNALAFDLYAGCPGFNVGVELLLMMTLGGILKKGDLSAVIGAEQPHSARAFRTDDTANIIFGDDALAASLETVATFRPSGTYNGERRTSVAIEKNFASRAAEILFQLNGHERLDGIIVDNQLGDIVYRVPAIASRVQDALARRMYPEESAAGVFDRFKDALSFYDEKVKSFAFDIMSIDRGPSLVEKIARTYVESGKYKRVASVYLHAEKESVVIIHEGDGFAFPKLERGVIDTETSTHGCFADFIEVKEFDGEPFGKMDGKGVFLYATRGAKKHIDRLLRRNGLSIRDIELLIEHQANFAMIPMTIAQLLKGEADDVDAAVRDFVANKMPTNIHKRGNCSVVCMQRLPFDLYRDALEEDVIQGYLVNANLRNLKNAALIMNDSVGAGMTRSSFLQRRVGS